MSRVVAPGAQPNEPFLSWERQRAAATFGLWIFLASEIVFFGALIIAYGAHRYLHPAAFEAAGAETNIWYGSINTGLLLSSSATMAVAAWAAEAGLKRTVLTGLGLTASLGAAFLFLKGFEYREDIHKHLVPGSPAFPLELPETQIFFSYYWAMTGLHAVHLTIGIGTVLTVAWIVLLDRTDWTRSGMLHALALYWHLIDVVWIVLYPLFYLVGRG